MKYTMTTPCDACPFLKGSGFTWRSLLEHASGEFACHKACKVDDSVVGEDSYAYYEAKSGPLRELVLDGGYTAKKLEHDEWTTEDAAAAFEIAADLAS